MKQKIIILICLFIAILLHSCMFQKPQMNVKASKNKIKQGEDLTLEWDIKDRKAKRIYINGVGDNLNPIGSVNVSPDTTTTYEIVVEYKKDSPIRRTCKIEVSRPTIVSFKAPDKVTDEESFLVEWRVDNADRIDLEGFGKKLKSFGNMKLKLDTTTTLELVARNDFNTIVKKIHTVEVELVEDFTAPDEIYRGEAARFDWRFKRCKEVTIDKVPGTYEAKASVKVYPTETTTYTFTIHDLYGDTRTEEHTVFVLEPEISYFTGPKTVPKEHEAILKWAVKGKVKISIKGLKDSLPQQGQLALFPEKTTNYTLIAKGENTNLSKSFTIEVIERRPFIKNVKTLKQLNSKDRIDIEIFATDISNYPAEIKLLALVVDKDGNYINGMAPDQKKATQYFKALSETIDQKKYDITQFSVKEIRAGEVKNDISLALDYTGSMENTINQLESAAKSFIERVDENNRMAIVKFNDSIWTVAKMNGNSAQLINEANLNGKINTNGTTALFAGFDLGVNELQDSPNKRTGVFFTDGNENASFLFYPDRAVNAEQLIRKARQNKARLHIIAYGDEVNTNLLKKVAQYTGGSLFAINFPEDIPAVYNEIPHILNNYYEITYRPMLKEGVREIKLIYNNQESQNAYTTTEIQINEVFDLQRYEYTGQTYWEQYIASNEQLRDLKPVTAPQAAAFFHFDKSDLLDDYKSGILKFVSYMKLNPDAKILILGHTDLVGYKNYCLQLSQRRANMVKQFIQSNGIDESRILIKPFGTEYPIWKAEEFDWQARENRRIELLLLKPKKE